MARFGIWLHCFGLALAGASRPLVLEDLSTEAAQLSLLQISTATRERDPVNPDASYFWSSRGADAATDSYVPYTGPEVFSQPPAWVWPNELGEQVRHSPLIDGDKNIYVCTTTKLRKFSPDGNLLWTWDAAPGQSISAAPALHNGNVYVLPCDFATPIPTTIDMESGKVNWQHRFDGLAHNSDAEAVLVADDILFFGASTRGSDGTDTVVAASASDGSLLWQYATDHTMWNFKPSTPGDRSLLFSSMCGAVFRISFEGELMWQAGTNHPGKSCVPAGGALGPNGIFYSEYSEGDTFAGATTTDTLAAYNVTDGSLVFKKHLPYRAAQYPAVGKLGPDGPLAVVAALGDNPMPPMPIAEEMLKLAAIPGGKQRNIVVALDAGTGETLWESEEEPWPSVVSAGEYDMHNPADGLACWPDAQGIPLISADGTVYTSSSHNGDLRSIRDSNHDGVISPSEVSTFKTGKGFLNSPSMAPGMLVAAPCWGPMYVFKN